MKGSILMLVTLLSSPVLSRPVRSSPAVKQFDSFLQAVNYAEPDEEFDELHDAGQNTWELSGKFEGDIILNDQQQSVLLQETAQPGLARNGLNDVSKRWPGKTLVYTINKRDFSSEQVDAIMDGIADLERSSCIKFKEKTSDDEAYVLIQGKRRGCYSNVGYQGRAQILNLTPHPVGLGCMSHGTIVHEMLHSLGFFHMQSSTKRDDFVKIQWDNILQGRENNFKKYNSHVTSDFGIPYDYDSVLHYSSFAFSKNGKKTIVPLNGDFVTIGQRVGLSEKDTTKLNRMYQCDGGDGGDEGSSRTKGGSGRGSGGYGGLETFSEDEDESSAEGSFFSDVTRRDSTDDDDFWKNADGEEFWKVQESDKFPKSFYDFKGWW